MTTTPTRTDPPADRDNDAAPETGGRPALPSFRTAPGRRRTGLRRRPRPTTTTNPPVELTPPGPLVPRWTGTLPAPVTRRLPDRRTPREPGVRARGWRGPGGGTVAYVESPQEWRATTAQLCGLWPYAAGSGSPVVGVPMGRHLDTGATVCADPISWFRTARLISVPSMFMLGNPALGKSMSIRRLCIGLAGQGVTPLILGDLRPDYADLVDALGGQVIKVGRGHGGLNPLDPGGLSTVLPHLPAPQRRLLAAERQGRQVTVVEGLVELVRGARLADHESAALSAGIDVLNERPGAPVLRDLVDVIGAGPDRVRAVVLDHGDDSIYRTLTDRLLRSLLALVSGPFGEVFAGHTSVQLDLDAPAVCLDTSSIPDTDTKLRGAALLACWAAGFAAMAGAQALTDAGLAPQRLYFAVLDELWQALRAGEGLVDRVDAITRLNRKFGLGYAMVTHTAKDLQSLPNPEDRDKAMGFIARAGYVALAGLPRSELDLIGTTIDLSEAERSLVSKWSIPAMLDPVSGREAPPPGRGKFLLKIAGKPGIPVEVELTPAELAMRDTNAKWQ